MNNPALAITNKEIFYTALMLGGERLAGIEYDFPTDEALLAQELTEAKRSLHKRKLLHESSKGEIKLADELIAVAAFCMQPDECVVVEESALKGMIYKVGKSALFLEPANNDEYEAYIFTDEDTMQSYLDDRLQAADTANTSQYKEAEDEQ